MRNKKFPASKSPSSLLDSRFQLLASSSGFTLIELLIFLGMFAALSAAFITVLLTVTRVQVRQASVVEVGEQSQFLLQQIQYYIEKSSLIDIPQDTPTSTLKLWTGVNAQDPTSITLASGTVYLRQTATGTLQALTSNKVTVSNLTFTRRANAPSHDSVSISFTLTYNTSNIQQAFSQMLQTSIARVSAATFDSNIIPSSTAAYSLGTSALTWSSINQTIYFSGSNVGIGTTANPVDTLELNGHLYLDSGSAPASTTNRLYNVSGNLYWNGTGIGGAWTTTSTGIFYNGGNVGIGTAVPAMKLDVEGGGLLLGGGMYVSPTNPSNTFNSGYASAADGADMWVNYRGYADGMSYYRNFNVGNGRGGNVAWFSGSGAGMSINNGQSMGGYNFYVNGTSYFNGAVSISGQVSIGGAILGQAGTYITSLPWFNAAGSPNGYIKLITPIVHNESNMFDIHIIGYSYNELGKTTDTHCGGYAYSGGGLIAYGCQSTGNSTYPIEIGTENRSGTTVVVIRIGTPTSSWYYNHYTAEYSGWSAKSASGFSWVTGETTPAQTGNTHNVLINDSAGTITTTGNVGIGTTAPSYPLDVYNNTTDGGIDARIKSDDTTVNLLLQGTPGGTANFGLDGSTIYIGAYNSLYSGNLVITSDGKVGIGVTGPGYTLTVNGTSWTTNNAWAGSDIRWKKNITPLTGILDKVNQLQAVTYDWRQDEFPGMKFSSGTQIGFIAQAVKPLFPELVTTDNNGYEGISYEKFVPVLAESIKEMQSEINDLQSQNAALQSQVKALIAR